MLILASSARCSECFERAQDDSAVNYVACEKPIWVLTAKSFLKARQNLITMILDVETAQNVSRISKDT